MDTAASNEPASTRLHKNSTGAQAFDSTALLNFSTNQHGRAPTNEHSAANGKTGDSTLTKFSFNGQEVVLDTPTLDSLYSAAITDAQHDAKGKRAKQPINIPIWLKAHLTRHMYVNNCFRSDLIESDRKPIWDFYMLYECIPEFCPTRDQHTQGLFREAIDKTAVQITNTIASQNGYSGTHLHEGDRAHKVIYPKYSRGYEHILESSWDGVLVKRFVEIAHIKDQMSYGISGNRYTLTEIDDLFRFLYETREKAARRASAGPGCIGDSLDLNSVAIQLPPPSATHPSIPVNRRQLEQSDYEMADVQGAEHPAAIEASSQSSKAGLDNHCCLPIQLSPASSKKRQASTSPERARGRGKSRKVQ